MKIKFQSPIVVKRNKLDRNDFVEILCFKCGVKHLKRFGQLTPVNYCPNCEKNIRSGAKAKRERDKKNG